MSSAPEILLQLLSRILRKDEQIGSVPETEPLAREVRRDSIAFVISTLFHVGFLVIAAAVYLGGGFGDEPTVINSTWGEELAEAVAAVEEIQIEAESTTGGLGGVVDTTSVDVASSITGAAASTALDAQISGGGLGGAFFGAGTNKAGAHGKRIVYIVDASGSMEYALMRMSRFHRVQVELESSILSLDASQRFAVIFFNDQARSVGARVLRYATDRNKKRAINEIHDSGAGGGTNPKGAIKRALRMKPDTIYFLTDGVFAPVNAAALMRKQRGLTVHTFTLGDSEGEPLMKRLADINGGSYRFVDGRPPATNESTAATAPKNGVANTP